MQLCTGLHEQDCRRQASFDTAGKIDLLLEQLIHSAFAQASKRFSAPSQAHKMLLSSLQVSFHRRNHKTKASAFPLPNDFVSIAPALPHFGHSVVKSAPKAISGRLFSSLV
jgi:hypothetical protein